MNNQNVSIIISRRLLEVKQNTFALEQFNLTRTFACDIMNNVRALVGIFVYRYWENDALQTILVKLCSTCLK